MLQTEHLFFIETLSDHLNSRKTTVPDDVEGSLLISESQKQQCAGIIYYQTHFSELQSAFAASSFYYANRMKLLHSIHILFADNDIPYLVFKGSEIARLYPIPALRTMGDSDILVHERDKQRAHDLLLSIGFSCMSQKDCEWCYIYGNVEIELHHSLIYDKLVTEEKQKEWTNKVWEYSSSEDGIEYHIEPEYHLVYLLIHIRKHLINAGVGFRQFMDVAVASKQKIDWEKVRNYLQVIGLEKFGEVSGTFINRWFGVSIPLECQIEDDFFYGATQAIFDNGVFGFDNEDHHFNFVVNKAHKNGRIISSVQALFPQYSDMCSVKEYSFVKGKPWLLPLAWIYRVLRAFHTKKVNRGLDDVLGPLDYMRTKRRDKYLKAWGLM